MAPRTQSPSRTSTATRKPPSRAAEVLYLYAISHSADFDLNAQGIDGASAVERVLCSKWTCWVSRVSRREFADELNERMQNLDWLAGAGIRHQQVVSAIAAKTDVLPARFATVFSSPESLQRHVQSEAATIAATFARIAGCDEWGVKIHRQSRAPMARNATSASGREYLEQKAASLQSAGKGRPDPDLNTFARELERHSRDSIAGNSQPPQPGVEWQASFLVPRSEQTLFLDVTTRWAERWHNRHRIECTGPWPPYSFVRPLRGKQPGGQGPASKT
jgi:hypothetical protein